MIGLGGGKQNTIDARAKQRARNRGAAGAERAEDCGKRAFEILHGIEVDMNYREKSTTRPVEEPTG
jgi:hypothetical protein